MALKTFPCRLDPGQRSHPRTSNLSAQMVVRLQLPRLHNVFHNVREVLPELEFVEPFCSYFHGQLCLDESSLTSGGFALWHTNLLLAQLHCLTAYLVQGTFLDQKCLLCSG